jgi:hypothetical protein
MKNTPKLYLFAAIISTAFAISTQAETPDPKKPDPAGDKAGQQAPAPPTGPQGESGNTPTVPVRPAQPADKTPATPPPAPPGTNGGNGAR